MNNFFDDLNKINQAFDGGVPRMLENHMVIGNQNAFKDGADEWEREAIKQEIKIDHDIYDATEYCGVYFDRDICKTLEPMVFAALEACSREQLIGFISVFRAEYFKQIDGYLTDMAEKELGNEN